MTVSRAFRDHPDLAPETKKRIIEAATKLGYSPGKSRSKKSDPQSTIRIGLVAYDSPGATFQSETPRRIYLAIQQECQRNGAETLVEFPEPNQLPMLAKNHAVSGIFLFGRYTPEIVENLKDIPTLAVSSYIQSENLPRIVANNLEGMRIATNHLIELGHRNILFLGLDEGPLTELYRERADGYSLAMLSHQLKPTLRFHPNYQFQSVLTDWTQFSAIVCATDGIAAAVHKQLSETGCSIPENLSLVGFDGTSEGESLGMTSYEPNWAMLGKVAANQLLFRPQDIQRKGLRISIPGRLIVRNSCQPPRS